MSCYYIQVVKGRKQARPVYDEKEYRALRGTSTQKSNLRLAREGNDAAKCRLVQFNYSGHYPDGIIKGNKLPSHTFGFDLDNPEEFKKATSILLENPDHYGLLMLERSARQGGHAVFRRESGKTILENQVRIATALQCEMDTNSHDINRVYFSTTDDPEELLYLNPDLFNDLYDEQEVKEESARLEARIEELPEGAHKADKHYKPWLQKEEEELLAETDDNTDVSHDSGGSTENYLGIPYDLIIEKWWQLCNDGQTPVKSNRDVLTYELALNLRHICGFDRTLLGKVIPCYDGFPESQKMKCIDSALEAKRSQMPRRLKEVLSALRRDMLNPTLNPTINPEIVNALDEVQQQDELFYFKRLPKAIMVQGIKDSIDAVGQTLTMPVITAICPIIGALATGVKLDIHGKENTLNLISYIVGEFGSGKGNIDPVVDAWFSEEQAMTKLYNQQWKEWRDKYRASKNKKEQPVEPKLPKRWLPLNNTVANLAEELENAQGKHALSFTPEADTVAQKWKSAMSDFSVMLRQSYDASSYDREARSPDAVNVHIEHLMWNVVMCGTPDALYRVVNNYTDGFQSRIAIARTPDNTFTPLDEEPAKLTEIQKEHIYQIAHLLPLFQGSIVLPKLEAKGREWLEEIRLESIKNDDRTLARQRFRVCVTAQRMMCCIMLCIVCAKLIHNHGVHGAELKLKQNPNLWKEMILKTQTPAVLEAYDVIADSLVDNNLFFFRDRIEIAVNSKDYAISATIGSRSHKGKNDSIYERLALDFTFEQALQQSITVKGSSTTHNSVSMMLKNWRKQGIAKLQDNGTYTKIFG